MARNRRTADSAKLAPAASTASSAPPLAPAAPHAVPGATLVVIFAFMMFLAPALGVPHERMLQDTLKSIVVAFAVLGAAAVFFWQQRQRAQPLHWHAVMWLPLLLLAYSLGSMVWSHTYLGGTEAVRWFIFALLLWLGLQCLSLERLPGLALGVHLGAVAASLWAALQFWIDLGLFPQGPHPASTFINRNFFAEFAVCTLPFSALLLARARQSSQIALLAATAGLVIVSILMTGTRSALIALWLQLLLVLPFIAWRWRDQLAISSWGRAHRVLAAGVLLGTVAGLGAIPTGDPNIAEEGRGLTALERGLRRTGSIAPGDASLGVRMIMWRATANLISQRPLAGVGAGAWESEIPLYQEKGAQLETDYYVHNEILQLLAEYGLVGWAFLLALAAYLLNAAWRTLRGVGAQAQAEAPWRAMLLCSLLALMVVSNVGFPWRMAVTGALFALCLASLAASDLRLGAKWLVSQLPWRPAVSHALLGLTAACLALAVFITHQAAVSESKIVSAARLALAISASGDPKNPKWDGRKAEMLRLIAEGIAINPHYRKITPIVADELARWGDWKNAIWIWDSVLGSRPHIVAIIANVARGYTTLQQYDRATVYLDRARRIQPGAPAVRSLEVILLARTGQEARALQLARQAIDLNIVDYDLANATFWLASGAGDWTLARRAIQLRTAGWPESAVQGYLQLGDMFAKQAQQPETALTYYRHALAGTAEPRRQELRAKIPPDYWHKLGYPQDSTPVPAPRQTSASKG